jgi:peptidoglycan/xylan/chitin deacetylase (PgdA/CDA1 family)
VTPIPILLYHSVAPSWAPDYARWCIDPALFADHLDAVLELGYTCLTVSQLVDATATATLPAKPLAITFDDGRQDFAEHAVAPMAARGVPSTMYVVSGHVGGTSAWLDIPGEHRQPMMTWSQLLDARAAGVEIGAHSVSHPELDVVGAAAAADEVSRSRSQLEDGMGSPVRTFAYPHGYYSSRVQRLVRDAGFDSAAAVHDRWSSDTDDRFALSRLIIDGDTTPERLQARLQRPEHPRSHGHPALRVGWRAVRRARRAVASARS